MLRISQAVDFSIVLQTNLGDALGTWSRLSGPKELLLRPNRASLDLASHYHLAEAAVLSTRDYVTHSRLALSTRVYVAHSRHALSTRIYVTRIRDVLSTRDAASAS